MSVIASVRWIALAQATKVVTQLVSVTVLARLLEPRAYGLMAMAALAMNLAYLFKDLGTGVAIINLPALREETLDTLHWANVGVGIGLAAILWAMAPFLGRFFGEPELPEVMRLLAMVFPIASLSVVHQALAERAARFDRVARAESLAALLGLVAALAGARLGMGVYSLVAQTLVFTAVVSVLMIRSSDHAPRLRWHGRALAGVVGFSRDVCAFNVINYAARNGDSLVIGRLLGAAPLGVYSLAYKVMLFPLQSISGVASRALYPALSRHRRDGGDAGALFLKAAATIAFVTAPLMAGLFALRDSFVAVVFGASWGAVAGVLAWLAPVGLLQSLASTTGAVLMATDRTATMFRLGMLSCALQFGAFLLGVRWGIRGVAACYMVANVVLFVPTVGASLRALGLGLRDLASAIWRALALAVAMGVLLALGAHLLQGWGVRPLPLLAANAVAGALAYLGASHRFNRAPLQSFTRLVGGRARRATAEGVLPLAEKP